MTARLLGLETDVHRFTGALEGFLGRIQIDDGLRLVQDNRRIGSVDPADLTLNFQPETADDMILSFDPVGAELDLPDSESEPEHFGSEPMVISNDDDEGPSDIPSFVAGTASTPSENLEDIRMEQPVSEARVTQTRLGAAAPKLPSLPPAPAPELSPGPAPELAPIPAGPAMPANVSPPPPPTVNLIPATPQTSQETAGQSAQSLVPQYHSSPSPHALPEPTRARVRSRTPIGSLGLQPPMTRSRSRSKTPL